MLWNLYIVKMKIPNMRLVRYSPANVIMNVSALVADNSSSLQQADISL